MTAPDSRDSVELLPCPFCGSADVDVMYAGEVVYVACRGCDAEGSKWRTEKTAVKHWNNRQALARGNRASGSHPDALPDGTFSKSTVKRRRVLQQAGGEVAELLDWLRWLAGDKREVKALEQHYAALQAEVARLLGQNERLASAVRDTITRAETAEAALREADAASKEPR